MDGFQYDDSMRDKNCENEPNQGLKHVMVD